MVKLKLLLNKKTLAIEPEVIPLNSKEGEEAKQIFPKYTFSIAISLGFILLTLLLKTIFSTALMLIGLIFLWKSTSKMLSNSKLPS